jgi:hypothetical protein
MPLRGGLLTEALSVILILYAGDDHPGLRERQERATGLEPRGKGEAMRTDMAVAIKSSRPFSVVSVVILRCPSSTHQVPSGKISY